MGKQLLTTEDIYEIVTSKGYEVDYPDGSCNEFRLVALANGMGYKEVFSNVWIKQRV